MPAFDAVALALAIRFTGGAEAELWLFLLFMLIASAMDPRPVSIEIAAPLVTLSYVGATAPDLLTKTGVSPKLSGHGCSSLC